METTVGKKKFAVAKKKVAVAKKNFTPLLHKGVKSFFGAQRNAFSLTSSTLKVSKNAERCGTNVIYTLMWHWLKGNFFTSQFSLLDLYIHSLKVDRDKGVVAL